MIRSIISFLLVILVSTMFFFMVKSCVDEARKQCESKQGYYFRGHCIKDGQLID
jgi:hypothetical protein